jgi:hypothetical protein
MSRSRTGINRRRRGLAANRELQSLAAGANPLPRPLDLVHVTSVGAGREIISLGQIETRLCASFKSELVYLFLARPAFRLRNGEAKSDQINRFPCVFVLHGDSLGDPPFHIYPFDTGAALDGRYGDIVDPHVPLEDYELEPNLQAAQRHIVWAFGGNSQYFDGALRPGLMSSLPHFRSVGRGYLTIAALASTGSNRPDKRASAIEIAYSRHLPLKDHLRVVIIPQQLIEEGGETNRRLLDQLEQQHLQWKTYDWRPYETPDSFMDEITQIVRRILVDAGQLCVISTNI